MQSQLSQTLLAQEGRCADCQRPLTPLTAQFHRVVNVAVCANCDQWWQRELTHYAAQVGTLA